MVNRDSLKSFRRDAVLLNFARQEIVDEAALATAIGEGRVRGYFSDFPSPALADLPNVRATPHLGASTAEAEENCAVMAADQLVDFLRNGNIKNAVNFPAVYLERTEGARVAVTNRNVPGMLGQLLSVLAEREINVIDMINKSRADVAYNLIDIAAAPVGELIAEMTKIDGVINVRVFDP
jgi:D-3-phosphoglycerate dehydrogenase